MTGYEKRVAQGLLERAKEILSDNEGDDLSVNAVGFHLDNALEELKEIIPERDGVPA